MRTGKSVKNKVWTNIDHEVWDTARKELSTQAWSALCGKLKHLVEEEVELQIDNQVRDRVLDQVWRSKRSSK